MRACSGLAKGCRRGACCVPPSRWPPPTRPCACRCVTGQARLVDGPFAETKEMVGGFYLLDCATRDEAVAIARECPAAEWATVEVREVAPCYHGAEA